MRLSLKKQMLKYNIKTLMKYNAYYGHVIKKTRSWRVFFTFREVNSFLNRI